MNKKNLKQNSETISLLKWFAIIFMTIDHIGMIFFPETLFFREIGRIAFPLFAFILVHNYLYFTSDKDRYILRLTFFAIISQPFFFLVNPTTLNIFVLLALSLLMIRIIETIRYEKYKVNDILLFLFSLSFFFIFSIDYSFLGLFLIVSMYLTFRNIIWLPLLIFSLLILNISTHYSLMYMTFLFIPLIFLVSHFTNKYDLKKIGVANGNFFYIYYPFHLTFLYFIEKIINMKALNV